jgi:hypothetical protein
MEAVRFGVIEIDAEGRCWRNNPRRRAESSAGNGYLKLRYQAGGRKGIAYAHRVVYRALVGEIPVGLTINHRNGTKDDNQPGNLEPATYSYQIQHAKSVLGRRYKDHSGEGNNMVKLKPAQVLEIRRRRDAGELLASIAADFGIVYQTVSRIARGGRWLSLAEGARV